MAKKKSTKLGLNINLNDLDSSKYYDQYKYIIRKINEKVRNWTKGMTKDDDYVRHINSMFDNANRVKSGGKIVDRAGNFIRTTKDGLQQFAQNKEAFSKLSKTQQKALINSIMKMNNKDYFSKKGIATHIANLNEKSISTIKSRILAHSLYKEATSLGVDVDVDGLANEIFKRMCDEARNGGGVPSDQIIEEVLEEYLMKFNLDEKIQERLEDKINTNKIRNEDFMERMNKYRGGNVR